MWVNWTPRAFDDVDRLWAFLASKSMRAADAAAAALYAAPERLLVHPRIGARVERYDEEEARRLIVDKYEIWYAILGEEIRILRVFHTKEDR